MAATPTTPSLFSVTCDACGEEFVDEGQVRNDRSGLPNVCPQCQAAVSLAYGDGAEIISIYTREMAIADGELVDLTEWASSDKGFHGGFTVPVAVTRTLWSKIEAPKRSHQDTRGRAHDVLWMASLAARKSRGGNSCDYLVIVGGRKLRLRMVIDGDGVTIGFPEDF